MMIATSSIPDSETTPSTSRPSRGSLDADADRNGLADDGLASPDFGVLLDSMRATAPVGKVRESSGRLTASQMFEPSRPDGHERGRIELNHGDPRGKTPTGDTASHTDVEARRARQEGQTDSGDRHRADFRPIRSGEPMDPRFAKQADRASQSSDVHRLAQHGERSEFSGRTNPATLGSAGSAEPEVAKSNGGTTAHAPAVNSAVNVSAVRSEGSPGSRSPMPAKLVGTILGAARGAAGQLSRATLGASNAGVADPTAVPEPRSQPTSARAAPTPSQAFARSGDGPARGEHAGQSLFDQLVRSIRLQGGERHSSARMQLDPPELGRVLVDVRVEGEQLQIKVRTESEAARHLLAQRAERLSVALEQHGLNVERFSVVSEPFEEHTHALLDDAGTASQDSAAHARTGQESSQGSLDQTPAEDVGEHAALTEADDRPGSGGEGRIDIRI